MILGCALILITALASPDSLGPAQAAFARGDYGSAEALALAAAEPPAEGAALYLVGLARFREGRPTQALEAFDAAGRASDAPEPGLWQLNRGACLYQLGRFAESEAAYSEAAALDASIAPLALVNAAFAAYDGGSPERARTLADRARTVASGASAALLADLDSLLAGAGRDPTADERHDRAEAEYAAGMAAYDAGRFDEARSHFRRAVELEPSTGRFHIMQGAAALKLGNHGDARAELTRALALPLEGSEATIARDYLDTLSYGLAAGGLGWDAAARAGGGIDTNVLQSGERNFRELAPIASGAVSSAFASGGVALAYRWRAHPRLVIEAAYALDELAYLGSAAADDSLQQHAATAALEWTVAERIRIGAFVGGQLAFTGLSSFRGLQTAAGGGGWTALDESDVTTTRVELGWTRKAGLGQEFSYLGGNRLDGSLTQELRVGALTFDLSYRYRDERIGTLTQPAALPLPPMLCSAGCSQEYVIPFGYTSSSIGLSMRAWLGARWRVAIGSGLEFRRYLDDSYLLLALTDGTTTAVDRRRREDDRFFASIAAAVRLGRGLALAWRYDLAVNRSNIDNQAFEPMGSCASPDYACHRLDYDSKNYTKHVLTTELNYRW